MTGGAGFIGSALCAALAEAGIEVRILDDLSTGSAENCAPEHELVVGDVTDVDAVEAAVRGCDAVVHLAARISVADSFDQPELYERVNVGGTRHVRDACRLHAIKRLVFASSCAVYGASDGEPLCEEQVPAPASPYAESKLAGEALVGECDGIALRFFNVYGPRQRAEGGYAAAIPSFFRAALRGAPLELHGGGRQTRDFVYVADVVRAIRAALAQPAPGVVNVGSGAPIEIARLARTIVDLCGSPSEIVETPARQGDLLACTADLARTQRQLAWRPTCKPQDGLAETLAWWKATGFAD